MSNKLVVVATVTAQPGKAVELKAALQTLVPVAKTEQGFVQYDLHVSNEDAGEFLFYEIWNDEAALQLHSNSEFSKAFGEKYGHLIKNSTLTKFTRIS
ncbi:putative quinol monooxygenase [Pseudomonas fluorescens]|uniref:putative quinol monooxygenase n=1 Tax=Pseudomonas fluorescens TaxID=294 RepID=UPI0010F28F39|nr:putative quinol monooxygenase [Pseudomonas fluorescens]TCV66237.1 quinol monooxygenase YgiN [Pseudomonas fluorescens]